MCPQICLVQPFKNILFPAHTSYTVEHLSGEIFRYYQNFRGQSAGYSYDSDVDCRRRPKITEEERSVKD